MLLVKWRPEAILALADIIDYIEQHNPVAAATLHRAIVVAAEGLSSMPYGFKPGRLPGTREMVVHPNYLLVYRVLEQIEILGYCIPVRSIHLIKLGHISRRRDSRCIRSQL